MANVCRIKENANKGIYKDREVIVLERNHIYDYAKIIMESSSIPLYIRLSELH